MDFVILRAESPKNLAPKMMRRHLGYPEHGASPIRARFFAAALRAFAQNDNHTGANSAKDPDFVQRQR